MVVPDWQSDSGAQAGETAEPRIDLKHRGFMQ